MNNLNDYKYPEWGEQFPGMIPVSGSGGGGVMEINVSFTDMVNFIGDYDCTLEDIIDAIESGKIFKLNFSFSGSSSSMGSLYTTMTCSGEENDTTARTPFGKFSIGSSSGVGYITFSEVINERVKVSPIGTVPNATPSDEGKTLSVNSFGQYALAQPNEPFVVTFSGTTAGGNAACDKTLADLVEHSNNLKVVYNRGEGSYIVTSTYMIYPETGDFFAYCSAPGSGEIEITYTSKDGVVIN